MNRAGKTGGRGFNPAAKDVTPSFTPFRAATRLPDVIACGAEEKKQGT